MQNTKTFLRWKTIMNEIIILPAAAKYIKKIKDKSLKKAFQNAVVVPNLNKVSNSAKGSKQDRSSKNSVN